MISGYISNQNLSIPDDMVQDICHSFVGDRYPPDKIRLILSPISVGYSRYKPLVKQISGNDKFFYIRGKLQPFHQISHGEIHACWLIGYRKFTKKSKSIFSKKFTRVSTGSVITLFYFTKYLSKSLHRYPLRPIHHLLGSMLFARKNPGDPSFTS